MQEILHKGYENRWLFNDGVGLRDAHYVRVSDLQLDIGKYWTIFLY